MIRNLLDNRYKITQELPEGGFGKPYLAEDTKRPGNPDCLVKQLHPQQRDPASLQKAFEWFEREAQTLEKLGKHDRIFTLLAYLQEHGEFYLVQEYIQGYMLSYDIFSGKPWPEDKVIQLLIDIFEPLEFVHEHNVIHRLE